MDLNSRIEQWLTGVRESFRVESTASPAAQRPHVTLSYAQSWDGSITTRPGETLALSSDSGTKLTHMLRSCHDGILVGIGTVLADDPRLTVREWTGNNPQPIVLDSKLRMPASSRLCQGQGRRCWVVTSAAPETSHGDFELISVPGDDTGHVNLQLALEALYVRGIHSLMVEGGAAVIAAFLRARLADAIVLTVAPLLVGGYKAIDQLHNERAAFPRISPLSSEQLGDEMIVWGQLRYDGAST